MAKDKGMKEDNVLLLLKDRSKGETVYRTVSIQQIFKESRFCIIIEFFRISLTHVLSLEFMRLCVFSKIHSNSDFNFVHSGKLPKEPKLERKSKRMAPLKGSTPLLKKGEERWK